jgi:hypothetical protein
MSLEEALSEEEKALEKVRAQWSGVYMIPTHIIGSDPDLDDFLGFVEADGRGHAKKTTVHAFSADSSSFVAAVMEQGKEWLPVILSAYLAARRKTIEIKIKDKSFKLVNPDRQTLDRVLKIVERITIKDKK